MMDERERAVELFDRWTALWNGELGLAAEIMADQFILRYGQPGTEMMDDVSTPDEIARLISHWRTARAGPLFAAIGEPVVQLLPEAGAMNGVVVRPYNSSFKVAGAPVKTVSGIDMLYFREGRIFEVLSVSGGRDGRAFFSAD